MLTKEGKQGIIEEYQHGNDDTGSVEVQVALLSGRIKYLTTHLRTHRKDNHSRRGLLKLVGNRRRLLTYLNKRDPSRYTLVISRLGLRR
jgi:small subunit ribosomal protein S15